MESSLLESRLSLDNEERMRNVMRETEMDRDNALQRVLELEGKLSSSIQQLVCHG